MTDDPTTAARAVLEQIARADGWHSATKRFHPNDVSLILRAMLAYAATARRAALEEAARVADLFAAKAFESLHLTEKSIDRAGVQGNVAAAVHLAAAIRQLGDAGRDDGWRTIESAPMRDLVYLFGRHDGGGAWWNIGFQAYDDYWVIADVDEPQPSHWRPLPAPPADREASDA